jgi:hypothetical protein
MDANTEIFSHAEYGPWADGHTPRPRRLAVLFVLFPFLMQRTGLVWCDDPSRIDEERSLDPVPG